jgi:glycosyltransferase involved in cell wall biosynthesis
MYTPLVTIGILSWNRLQYLRATLESARFCIQYPNLQWIVSDNESEESGLHDYIHRCDWVQHKIFKKQTHAAAMNQLVDMAQGDYILIWPEDVQFTVKGDWLVDLVEILNQHRFIGSIGLDFQRQCTLHQRFTRPWHDNRHIGFEEFKRFGLHFRRRMTVHSSRGFKVRTCGFTMPGICGSGIPSLTRTAVWRKLGPWKTTRGTNANLIDSSLGAEDDMVARFYARREPLQMGYLVKPVAADILTDPTGCKAKVRGNRRYGVYLPPPEGSCYYRIKEAGQIPDPVGDFPIAFMEGVEPIGFTIPLDSHGDPLKSSINKTVVADIT